MVQGSSVEKEPIQGAFDINLLVYASNKQLSELTGFHHVSFYQWTYNGLPSDKIMSMARILNMAEEDVKKGWNIRQTNAETMRIFQIKVGAIIDENNRGSKTSEMQSVPALTVLNFAAHK